MSAPRYSTRPRLNPDLRPVPRDLRGLVFYSTAGANATIFGLHFRWTTTLGCGIARRGGASRGQWLRATHGGIDLIHASGFRFEALVTSLGAQPMVEMSQISAFTFGGLVQEVDSYGHSLFKVTRCGTMCPQSFCRLSIENPCHDDVAQSLEITDQDILHFPLAIDDHI